MKIINKITLVLAIFLNMCGFIFTIFRFSEVQLVVVFCFVLYILWICILLFSVLILWKNYKWISFHPLMKSMIGIAALFLISMPVGSALSNYIIKGNVEKYKQVVELINAGKIQILEDEIGQPIDVPKALSPLSYRVTAGKDLKEGYTIVTFWTGRGFPVKHSGCI